MTTKQQVTDLTKNVLGLAKQVEALTNLVINNQPTKAKTSRKTAARTKKTAIKATVEATKATPKAKLVPISKAKPVTNNTGTKLVWLCMNRETGKLFQTPVGDSKSYKANRAKGQVVGVLNLTANKLTIDNADKFIGKHNL